jgi:hypothetical protein
MHEVVIHRGQAPNGELTETVVGFQGFDQSDLLLVWREYYDQYSKEVVWAKILFRFDGEEEEEEEDDNLRFAREAITQELVDPSFTDGPSLVPPIKAFRAKTGWGLKESKEYVDFVQQRYFPNFRTLRR